MTRYQWTALCLAAAALCRPTGGEIERFTFADPRGLGLAGALTPATDDAAAGWVNPAVLGFMARASDPAVDNNGLGERKFGWSMLDVGAGATLTGDLGDYLQVLADTDFARYESPAIQSPENIKSLLLLAGTLSGVGENDTIVVNAHAGSLMHMGHFAVGVRTFGQLSGWINDLDLVNLGLQFGAQELADDLRAAIADEGFDPAGHTLLYLTGDNFQKMRDAFGGSATNDDVVAYLDYKLDGVVQEGGLDPAAVQKTVDTVASIVEASDLGNSLSNNTTSITGRGFLAVEVPISCGYAFSDRLAVGATARAIFGRVYGTQIWAFNEDNADIIADALDTSVDRVNIGLDLAMMYRMPGWQFSLAGRNLNRPEFAGYSQTFDINGTPETVQVPDVVLDPQIAVAAAWMPMKRILLASELELLKTGTLQNNYDVQRLSFGSELDLVVLRLRLGTYKNIAESDLGWVLTGGAGFHLWAVNIDAGAAVSIDDTVVYDGMELPRTVQLNLGLSFEF